MAVKPDVISSVSKEMAKLTKYNSSSLLLWGCFLSLTILVWMFGSSGDFSFLLTFAALWRCFGFGLLNYKVWSGMNVRSVSKDIGSLLDLLLVQVTLDYAPPR